MSKEVSLALPVVSVIPSPGEMLYRDTVLTVSGSKRNDKLDSLFYQLGILISDTSSVILYKEDVKRLADQLSGKSISSKDIFQLIKHRIRAHYTVLKLSFDPRSLQFNGLKTAFIIHKRINW